MYKYRVWAAFSDKGSPLFIDVKADSVEDAMEIGVNFFAKAIRIFVEVPLDNDE